MKKIFIIEDNTHLLSYLESHLQKVGYGVLSARSGLDAIEQLAENSADVIFIDYFLPNLNANRLCQIIRRMEHLKHAYVVVMSAAASELDIDTEAIGANAIIAKGSFKMTMSLCLAAIRDAEKPSSSKPNNRIMGLGNIYPRQMTKELLAQNHHLQAILDSISEGIVEIYKNRVVYANPASENLLNMPQARLLTSYLPDIFEGDMARQIKTFINSSKIDSSILKKDKSILLNGRYLWMKRLPLHGDDDTVILLITDVTDRIRSEESLKNHQQHLETLVEERTSDLKRAHERLRKVQKMEAIGTIAGGVAHDLNNILSGIVSYPDLLLMELPKDAPIRKPILTIKKSGEKAAAIVQDLLTLARRGVASNEVADLNAVVSEYLKSPEFMKMKSYHTDVEIETDLEKSALNVLCSPVHMSKTLMNLVSNAAEAMPEGGTIRISTENRYVDRKINGYEDIPKGEYVVLSVEDTGIGLSPSDMGRVFEPFYTKKTMGRSGSGLGMAVVWGTIKDHNGFIDINSVEGKGTIFELYFNATRETLSKNETDASTKNYMGHNESVMIVDDAEDQREIASVILKRLGYQVSSVSSGEQAVEYLGKHSIDLIVMDMIMEPGIDGLETYQRIISRHPGQKAIIASGFSETERIKAAQKLGAGQYIRKPYTLEKIGKAVRKELDM